MSSIRKIGLLVGITGLVLTMASGTGYAASISISDLLDGNPVVAVVGLDTTCTGCSVTLSPEGAHIVAQYDVSVTGDVIALGKRSVQLLEPGGGPISDTITLNVGAVNEVTESIDVQFNSDNDVDLLPEPPPPVATIVEDGTLQDLTVALNSGGSTGLALVIRVQSDVSDVSAVPEPATLLLLGSGLAGLAGWRRRRLLRSSE